MIIAIASGKGGTGKTTVATNLAVAFAAANRKVQLIDCDVEEPNCRLLLDPVIDSDWRVTVLRPKVDETLCDHCGVCSSHCKFGGIICIGNNIMTAPELCHSCGGCTLLCPKGAISEQPQEVGEISQGHCGEIQFAQGSLMVGQPRAVPIIKELRDGANRDGIVLVDCPPGTACAMVEAVTGVDFVLLVAEPTRFGVYDLSMAVEVVKELQIPVGVVINRWGTCDDQVESFCIENDVPVIAKIPDDRDIARAQARGRLGQQALPQYVPVFAQLAEKLEQQATLCEK